MATIIHRGQQLRLEGSDLTLIVGTVHENPDASFAGNRLAPYADVTWSDGSVGTANLQSLQGSLYSDTGV